MPLITTPKGPICVAPDPIKGSRFYGLLAPITSEAEAKAHLQAVREDYPGATHYCWAYVLANGRALASDDGEPANSAGAPILRHIQGSKMVNLQIVVVRFFGGTKLGVGGLIRAYGDLAALALASVEVVTTPTRTRITFVHDHDLTGILDGLMNGYDLEMGPTQWGLQVERDIAIVDESVDGFCAQLIERSAGRVTPTVHPSV